MLIERLLSARSAVSDYYRAMKIKGKKTQADFERLSSALSALGFADTADFFEFNLMMNLQECDRCIRFRRLDNTPLPAVCDSCKGRSSVLCITSCTAGPQAGQPWIDEFAKYYPESQFMREQYDESVRLGVTPGFIVTPISYFMQVETQNTVPGYCIGGAYQIQSPQFDMMWGMENYSKHGVMVLRNMQKANGVI